MGLGQMLDVLKAISGGKKHYFEGITVTNVLPKKLEDFDPYRIKDLQAMISDPTLILKATSLTDNGRKIMYREYSKLNSEFQKLSTAIKKNWLLAISAEESIAQSEAQFGIAKRNLDSILPQVESDKAALTALRGKTGTVDGTSEKVKELEQSLRGTIESRLQKIEDKKQEVEIKIKGKTEEQQHSAEAILTVYANKRKLKGKEREDLIRGVKYNWGVATVSEDAKKAKDAYNFIHDLDKWKKEHFKHEMAFLKEPEKYNEGDFKTFNRELKEIDAQIKELTDQVESGKSLIKKMESLEKKDSVLYKYLACRKEYDSKFKNFYRSLLNTLENYNLVQDGAEKICGITNKFIEKYNFGPELAGKIQQSQEQGTINGADGGEIPLIIAVALVYYLFHKLDSNCSDKIGRTRDRLDELDKEMEASNNKSAQKYNPVKKIAKKK